MKRCLEIELDFKGTVQEWLGNRLRKLTGKTIRTQAAFEQSLRDNKGQLMTVANEASKIALDIMTLYIAIKTTQYRLDKYDNTTQKVQEVNRYAVRYWKDIEKKAKKESVTPEHDAFRWALEEFRVSLFAQHTKPLTPYRLNAWINCGMSADNLQTIYSRTSPSSSICSNFSEGSGLLK